MYILGINAYHGDASAALIHDGQLVAAAEEERFNRIKHSAGFPTQAVRYCLQAAGIKPEQIDHLAIARDAKARLFRKALYAVRMPRLTMDRLAALGKFAGIKEDLAEALETNAGTLRAETQRVEHHKAHLASSFFVSGYDQAALLSVDGLGDFASTMWGVGRGQRITTDGAIAFPHSLGIYYTAITQYLGFLKYGDEYKVMGLAAYGEPEYREEFKKIVCLEDQLRFNLGLDYFSHHRRGPDMTWRGGVPVLGKLYSAWLEKRIGPTREPGAPVEKRHANIAASLQARLEEALFLLLNKLYERTKIKKLCLAGGVAFNCVANGKIFERTPFTDVYIQPSPGDAGLAIGAAYHVYHQTLGRPRAFVMDHAYWGPAFSDHEINQALRAKQDDLQKNGCRVSPVESPEILCRWTAERIAEGKVLGLFQGRMEFGPRALGNRSIIVDPRRPEMKDILNKRIKHREPFRPFAPSILEEATGDYFKQSHTSPFMLRIYKVKPAKAREIPAPTHVDGSGRLQTVSRQTNPFYWGVIREFGKLTGVPVVLNTSFNENEPIVCKPEDAIDCFIRTKMEALVIGSYRVERTPH